MGYCMEKAALGPILVSFSVLTDLANHGTNKGTISKNLPCMDAEQREGGFTFQPRGAAGRTNAISISCKKSRKIPVVLLIVY